MTPHLQNKTFFVLYMNGQSPCSYVKVCFLFCFLINPTHSVIMSSDFFLCSYFVYFAGHTVWDAWNTDAAVLFGECPGSCVCVMYLFEEI